MNYSDDKVKKAGKVVQSFVTVNKAIIKHTKQNADSLGLTLLQMGILNTVAYNQGTTLKDVAEKLDLPKSTVSVNVDDLVKAGFIERNASENDRREVKLKTTDKGNELAKKSCDNAISYKAMISALEGIPESDIQKLLDLHEKILAGLTAN